MNTNPLDADFAVVSGFSGQFAWFLIEDDAERFRASLPRPDRYWVASIEGTNP